MIKAFCLDAGNTLLERCLKQLEDSPSVALFIFVIIALSDKVFIVVVVIAETGTDVDVISDVRWLRSIILLNDKVNYISQY